MNPNQQPAQAPSTGRPEFSDIMLSVHFDSQEEVGKKETGLKLARRIFSTQSGSENDMNFFKARSKQWRHLRDWATGKQSNKEFLNYLGVVDATKSYVNIDTSPILVGAQFVSTLVTSISKNEEYPCVTAVDDGSMTAKEQHMMEAFYRMHDAQQINQAEEAAGMMFEPPNPHVPEDELSAEVYFKTEHRLPKEIKYEQKLQANALDKCKYQRVLKPKLVFDFIVNNFGCIKIESDYSGGYKLRKCVPDNMVYSYFQNDSGEDELGYIGEVYSLKIRDIRKLFPSVTEKELFEFAKAASVHNVGTTFNYEWQESYTNYTTDRPYDESSIAVFDFEIQINLNDYYVSSKDSYGKENISERDRKPEVKSNRKEVKKKQKSRWYRGVYAVYGQQMIYWGLPDLVIFPFLDYECAMSSYTLNIPMNLGTYTPGLFERALEPLKEYALTKLKRKQIIAKLRPTGIRIDVESARNVTVGEGNTISWMEILRIYDQTGSELYSSKGVNPNEKENPAISQAPPNDDIQKVIELTNVLSGLIQEIRGLIGVPMYRDGSDVGDRTAAKLAEMQNTSSFNVTDHIPNGLNQLMEDVLYKCCILEWQRSVKEEKDDISADESDVNSRFDVSVKMKPTDYQKQLLEQRIAQWSQTPDAYGNPLLSPKDVYVVENIKDYKLAQRYLANVVETNRRKAMDDKAALDKMNSQNQAAAAQQANEGAMKVEQLKFEKDMQKIGMQTRNKIKESIVDNSMKLLATGIPIPEGFQPLLKLIIENEAMPLFQENQQMQQQQAEQAQQEQQQAQVMQISQQTGMPPEQIMQQVMGGEQQQEVA